MRADYLFDAFGYYVIPNALSPEVVERANRALDALDLGSVSHEERDRRTRWLPSISRAFVDLIDNERVLPYLTRWVGDTLRLDHCYALHIGPDELGSELHGEPDFEHVAWYSVRNGVIRNGLFVVSYALTDCPEGGFVCLPGSHKSGFDFPDGELTVRDAHEVAVRAGDAILFTEALVHGGAVWRGPEARRLLLYKYAPGHAAHLSIVWDDEARAGLTERQRRMVEPPYRFDVVARRYRQAIDAS